MADELENSVEHTEESLDALVDRVESDKPSNSAPRAMSKEEDKEEKAEKAAWESDEFTHSGKPIKGTREQILKWASQGYNYPQLVQKLNQEKTKWNQEREGWEKQWGIYRQIDDAARQNQEWWNWVQQQWQNRSNFNSQANQSPQANPGTPSPQTQPDPYAQKFQTLEQKLSQIEPLIGQLAEDRRIQSEKAEDSRLDQEVQSIREKHADLDWDSLDENGQSLEYRVLEHAQKTGIPTFQGAFRDLLHDELIARAASNGKLAVSKSIQAKTKLGVLGESPTPSRMPRQNRDIRKTSYEELESDIREELRSGQYR